MPVFRAAFESRWVPGLLGAVVSVLAACSPALDWREVRLEGPGLIALFPCRPVGQARELALGGAPVTMKLQACEAAGSTFAIGLADMGDPALVDAGLRALRDASVAKWSGAASSPTGGWVVAGMTPQPSAGRWQFSRTRPAGGGLQMDTAVFARGTWVIQASVIGVASAASASAPFFEGLRLAP